MRRLLVGLVAASLPLTALAFAPAASESGQDTSTQEESTSEESTPDPVTPDPIDVTMYFHGSGDRYVDDDRADPLAAQYNVMDRTEPTASDFESRQLLNYAAGPNPNCAGNYLFPVWTGFVGKGAIVGDATVTFDVIASGGSARVEVYTGVSAQACNDGYVQPLAAVDVALPMGQGTVEAVLPMNGMRPGFDLMVQLRPSSSGPLSFNPASQARVLYDGADYAGALSFTCQPDDITFDAAGKPSHDPTCLPF